MMETGLYQITPRGHSYIAQLQRSVESYYDRDKYAPAQPRYRLGVLEALERHNIPMTRDEIVTNISEGLIDQELARQWPLRAIRLREAIARQFEWLWTHHYIATIGQEESFADAYYKKQAEIGGP